MAKFKALSRFLGRILKKRKSEKQNLNRTSSWSRGWSAIWRRKSTSSNNGSTRDARPASSGLLRALSSFFRKSETKPNLYGENELRESYTVTDQDSSEGIDILVEPPANHSPLEELNDVIDYIHYKARSSVFYDDASLSSLESVEAVTQQTMKEKHSTCQYYQGYLKEVATQPEDWESSSEWLIFDVVEEPKQIVLKPKKVTWKDDDEILGECDEIERLSTDHELICDSDHESPSVSSEQDYAMTTLERLSTEFICDSNHERPSVFIEQDDSTTTSLVMWQWITAISIVFVLLLLM